MPEPLKFGPKGEYSYQHQAELAREVHRACAPGFFAETRLRRVRGQLQRRRRHFHRGPQADHCGRMNLPVARAGDYESFRRAVGADLGQHLSVENTVAGAPVPPADMKADDLVESARAAADSGNLARRDCAAEARDRSRSQEQIRLEQSRTHLSSRCAQDDQAIAAFQKQLEVNPYDEFAYNNLGRVYWKERKYDDAVKAFNKQLENNPLDKFAHANLGAMYAEWHKYDLAVAELEKAASLTSGKRRVAGEPGRCLPESGAGRQGAGGLRPCG